MIMHPHRFGAFGAHARVYACMPRRAGDKGADAADLGEPLDGSAEENLGEFHGQVGQGLVEEEEFCWVVDTLMLIDLMDDVYV